MDKLRLFLLLLTVQFGLLQQFCVAESPTSPPFSDNRAEDPLLGRPRKITVEAVGANGIKLNWEAPRVLDGNCPVRRYMVRLREDGEARSKTWKIDGAREALSLHDLSEDTTYYIRLMAVTCRGKGARSRWIQVKTGLDQNALSTNAEHLEIRTPGEPTYVRTHSQSDSVTVNWEAPKEDIVVRGYKIGYSEGVPDLNWRYVDGSKRNITINGLKPATEYVISLCALNSHGEGAVVYELVSTQDLQATNPGQVSAPENVRAKVLSSKATWIRWSDPSLGRQQQLVDKRYYNVHYQALPNGKTLSVIVNKALHVVLNDLKPGTTYAFKVRAVTETATSPFSKVAQNRTFEAVPSTAPRSLNVLPTNDSATVHLTWRPPRESNGYITAYLVLYTTNQNTVLSDWENFGVPGANTQVTISTLSANTTYFFKVQARNSKGYGPASDTLVYTTTVNQVKGKPGLRPGDRGSNEIISEEVHNKIQVQKPENDGMLGDEFDPDYVNGVHDPYSQPGDNDDRGNTVSASHQRQAGGDGMVVLQDSDTSFDLTGHSSGPLDVSFQFVVKHTVTAVVRWELSCKDTSLSRTPVTYVIRYYPQDSPSSYTEKTTPTNFVMLDNLRPNQKYAYKVKQIEGSVLENGWSEVGFLDTSYPTR